MLGSLKQITKDTPIEEAFEFLCLIRTVFEPREWDKIVECKTRLHEIAHEQEGKKQEQQQA
jgi:hypothetical protein